MGSRAIAVVAGVVVVAAAGAAGWWLLRGGWEGAGGGVVARALAEGRVGDAVSAARDRVERESGSGEGYYWLARAELAADHPNEAVKASERARALGVDGKRLEPIIGIVFARSGRVDDAEPLLARDRGPGSPPDPDMDEALARVHMAKLRYGKALEAIDRWSEARPSDARPYLWRARIDRGLKVGPEQLEAHYREALARDPDLEEARLGLADALRSGGKLEEALGQLMRHLEGRPDDARVLGLAGRCALEAGRDEDALRFFDRAIAVDPTLVEALDGRAAVAIRQRDYATALALVDRAIALDPINPDFHYRRATVLGRLGKTEEAREARETTDRLRREAKDLDTLRTQVLKKPSDLDLQAALAQWLLEHGRGDEGAELARRVLSGAGRRPELASRLAEHYRAKGDAGLANYYQGLARRGSGVP